MYCEQGVKCVAREKEGSLQHRLAAVIIANPMKIIFLRWDFSEEKWSSTAHCVVKAGGQAWDLGLGIGLVKSEL